MACRATLLALRRSLKWCHAWANDQPHNPLCGISSSSSVYTQKTEHVYTKSLLIFLVASHSCFSWMKLFRPFHMLHNNENRLAGLMVKASASGALDPGFESHLPWDFSRSSHTSDLKIGTPVATLPGAWHYKVRAGTGLPSVSIL